MILQQAPCHHLLAMRVGGGQLKHGAIAFWQGEGDACARRYRGEGNRAFRDDFLSRPVDVREVYPAVTQRAVFKVGKVVGVFDEELFTEKQVLSVGS